MSLCRNANPSDTKVYMSWPNGTVVRVEWTVGQHTSVPINAKRCCSLRYTTHLSTAWPPSSTLASLHWRQAAAAAVFEWIVFEFTATLTTLSQHRCTMQSLDLRSRRPAVDTPAGRAISFMSHAVHTVNCSCVPATRTMPSGFSSRRGYPFVTIYPRETSQTYTSCIRLLTELSRRFGKY